MSTPSLATGPVALVTTWVWRLATATGTWWLQTLAGGVVLGFAPATVTLYRQLGHALDGGDADDGVRAAWRAWRENFWDSQVRFGLPALTVAVFAWYVLALRGTPFAVTIAVLGVVYVCWLLHVPAVATRTDLGVRSCWLLTAQLMARAPLRHAAVGLGTGALVVAAVLWFPGGLVLLVPAVPAAAASLVTRDALTRSRS